MTLPAHLTRKSGKPPPYEKYFPTIPGNSVTLLTDAAEYFPVLFAAAESAEKSLLVESYIFGDDAVGARMLAILIERAQAGVQVRLILDGFGSQEYPMEKLIPLLAEGAEIWIYRPWHFFRRLFSLNFNPSTDHRKMVIVDGRRVILGGINIRAAEQTGWHDFMIDIEGPAARAAAELFSALWRKKNRPLDFPLGEAQTQPAGGGTPSAGDKSVRILGNHNRRTRRAIIAAYCDGLRAAQHEMIIANAYFLPDWKLRRLLYLAVKKGVRIRLLLPETSDVPSVQAASEYFYHRLLRRGVEIHLYGAAVLHAKAAVVDGRWLTVGSYNLDHQSLAHNLEVTAVVEDEALGGQLRDRLFADIARSRPLDLESWRRRPWRGKLRSWFWHFFTKLM